jgi:hypothetical protein
MIVIESNNEKYNNGIMKLMGKSRRKRRGIK